MVQHLEICKVICHFCFNTAVSMVVDLLKLFFPVYFLCFYCLADWFWSECVGLPEYFLCCLHLLCKSFALNYFPGLWRHVALDCISSRCLVHTYHHPCKGMPAFKILRG